MELMQFAMATVSILLTICAFLVLSEGSFKTFWGVIALLCFYLQFIEVKQVDTDSYYTEETVTIVSAAPPSNITTGNFVLGSGTIGNRIGYLLRSEIKEGLYKDFQVVHDVFIKEEPDLTTKGLFTKRFKCHKEVRTFVVAGSVLEKAINERCRFFDQTIHVPVGHVVKYISI